MLDKVVTMFRNKRSVSMDKIYEGLIGDGIDPDVIQIIYTKESPEFFTFFGVHEMPTVLLFSNGEEIKRLVGKEITTEEILAFLK